MMEKQSLVNNSAKYRFLQLRMLDRAQSFSPLVIRAFLATFLIYMSQDNVFSAPRMQEFVVFMTEHGFPVATVLAPLSVYAQFTCGLLIGAGLFTRLAAAIMVVNFVVAIAGVHIGTSSRTFLEPMAMLSASLFLLMHGPGRIALDNLFSGPDESGAGKT